jgi:hypothetical protein
MEMNKPQNKEQLTLKQCHENALLMAQYIATLEWYGAGRESGVLAKSYEQLAYWNKLKEQFE